MDRACKGHGESLSRNYLSGHKSGITTRKLERSLKRRQSIEPVIGLLKSDVFLGRNYMKDTLGKQMKVLLCCASHKLRLVLKPLKFFCPEFLAQIWQWIQCLRSLDRRIGEFKSGGKFVDDGLMELLPLQQLPTAA